MKGKKVRNRIMKEVFQFREEDFSVTIFRKNEEKETYYAKLATSFDEKDYFNDDLELLVCLLKHEIKSFGKLLKLQTEDIILKGSEILSLALEDSRYIVDSVKGNFELLVNECDLEFAFFDEPYFDNVREEFYSNIEVFFKKSCIR